ncbi:TIGR04282 family arsenosugar biosynthesis glycosyltransferase [bacterium]|nr:TIGR04282 family arsenosugar biosynthesis glycosyltransferase [bacterium]
MLLLIFVKHPIPGQVKTRLGRTLGMEKAAEIYGHLLAFTLKESKKSSATKAVFYGNTVPEQDLWSEAGYPRFSQKGDGLGERMQHAFEWGFAQGHERIAIIGSDCPNISGELITEAFERLKAHDFVMGPADDGGYYLLGMSAPFYTPFHEKIWSTGSVFQDTIGDLVRGEKSYALLPMYSDIDEEIDLKGTFLEKTL